MASGTWSWNGDRHILSFSRGKVFFRGSFVEDHVLQRRVALGLSLLDMILDAEREREKKSLSFVKTLPTVSCADSQRVTHQAPLACQIRIVPESVVGSALRVVCDGFQTNLCDACESLAVIVETSSPIEWSRGATNIQPFLHRLTLPQADFANQKTEFTDLGSIWLDLCIHKPLWSSLSSTENSTFTTLPFHLLQWNMMLSFFASFTSPVCSHLQLGHKWSLTS